MSTSPAPLVDDVSQERNEFDQGPAKSVDMVSITERTEVFPSLGAYALKSAEEFLLFLNRLPLENRFRKNFKHQYLARK